MTTVRLEQLPALQIVEHLPHQGVDVVHGAQVAGVPACLRRRARGDRNHRRVVVGRLDRDRGVVVQESEERTRRIAPAEPARTTPRSAARSRPLDPG